MGDLYNAELAERMWNTGRLNNIRDCVREIVNEKIIYA